MARPAVWIADRRSDARGIPDCVGINSPAGASVRDGLLAGNVARTYDHWKNQTHPSIFPTEGLNVAKADINVVAGHEIRDRGSEDVGALLFDKSSALPFGLGGIVDAFCLFALADGAANQAIANADFQVVDRAVVRQGKNIDSLDGVCPGVHVLLRDRSGGCQTAHVECDVGVDKWDGLEATGDGRAVKKRALADRRRCVLGLSILSARNPSGKGSGSQ